MSKFHVLEHSIRCHDTRDRTAAAGFSRANEPRLHVKQYLPKINSNPRPGDVTILAVNADGLPEGLYESLWDDLLEQMQARKRRLRSIWIVDIANQGQSSIDDEEIYSAEENERDYGRDLLLMVNQLRDQMPGPLIAIGHGAGTAHLVHLSLLSPRLLDSLILVEPTFSHDLQAPGRTTRVSALRHDIWPARPISASEIGEIRLCQQCDEPLPAAQIGYALSDLPIKQHSEPSALNERLESPVTLTTADAEDDFGYFRADERESTLLQDDEVRLDVHPGDLQGCQSEEPDYHRVDCKLSELRPSVLYMFGAQSPISASNICDEMLNATGTGIGGSGGAAKGRVKAALIDGGHLLSIDEPKQCAEEIVHFMDAELDRWATEQRQNAKTWNGLTQPQRLAVGDLWLKSIGMDREHGPTKPKTRTSKL